jgi:hypothetical protein
MPKILGILLLVFLYSPVFGEDDCTPDVSGYITCNNYYFNASENIDMRVRTLNNKNTNLKVFYVQDHTTPHYERNTNCWAYDFDMTCVSPWNSREKHLRTGTLITPRHAICAKHYDVKKNDSIRFITKDNQIIQRKVLGSGISTEGYYPDIDIMTLDSDVPSSIKPCKFLPADYADYIPNNGNGIPALAFDQEEKALVADISYISTDSGQRMFSLKQPTNSARLNFSEQIIGGDSSNPAFIIINGELILLGVFTWGGYGSGSSLTYFANLPDNGGFPNISLNDIIKMADKSAGIPATNYKVTFFDFSTAPSKVDDVTIDNKVFAKGTDLHIELTDNPVLSKIEIFDTKGSMLLSTLQNQISKTYHLNRKGLFLIRISNLNTTSSYKILIP